MRRIVRAMGAGLQKIILLMALLPAMGVCLAGPYPGGGPYVGYWGTVVDQPSGGYTDYTYTLAPHASISYINANESGTYTALQSLASWNAQANTLTVKGMVSVQGFFFTGTTLNANWNAAGQPWPTFVSAMNAAPSLKSLIAAIYVYDEPNGLQPPSTTALQTEINAIRAAFPGVPLAMVYVPSTGAYPLISAIDWAGADCYSNGVWKCSVNGTQESYSKMYTELRAQLNANQSTILVPQAGYQSDVGCCNVALENEVNYMSGIAVGDPKVAAIVSFIWPTTQGGVPFHGLNEYQGTGSMAAWFGELNLWYKQFFAIPVGEQAIFQAYDTGTNNHFNTKSATEALGSGFSNYFGPQWTTYTSQVTGTIELYRCLVTGTLHHFASSASNCEGQTVEGSYGYVYNATGTGRQALYRYHDATNGDFYDSTQATTPTGYTKIGILGYVPVLQYPTGQQ